MSPLQVRLFGKVYISHKGVDVNGINAPKVQELFCYLLLFRDRPHPRETLAELFWGNRSIAHSKKYLRQALWQIQSALSAQIGQGSQNLLTAESEWVMLNSSASLWLDVAEFENSVYAYQSKLGRQLDPQGFQELCESAELYRGDLLQGCYQDWCLFERERLQNIFLALLDKLMDYCEAHQEYETGLKYGSQILRHDYARERTHRRLMRLYYLSGNRTEALRQYKHCKKALKQELDVQPSLRTTSLYNQIRLDRLPELSAPSPSARSSDPAAEPLSKVLVRLNQLHQLFYSLQEEIKDDIQLIERTLR